MKRILFTAYFFIAATAIHAQTVVELWPGGAPGDSGLTEVVRNDGTYKDVTEALIEIYRPENPNGQAVIICPGGSYTNLAYNHEGREVAKWLNERDITGVVLKYRMPGGHSLIPGSDVRKAIETVREMGPQIGVDPSKVGVIGFSAGGHLASTAVTHYTSAENRPDFGILVYPVISMTDELTHFNSRKNLTGAESYSEAVRLFSNETRVTEDTPPVLILFSHDDDVVDARNGSAFYDACVRNGVPAELHIYPSGGHGWGWRDNFRYEGEMKSTVERWLSEQ